MLLPSPSPISLRFISQVQQTYVSLMQCAAPPSEESLGGNLLYADELDEAGRILVAAGNIAGAESLAASADIVLLRQAMRDGIIDFLVTSLDEALRIFKNEIRKRQPVAVAVSVPPQIIVNEMLDRGVLPDLLPPLLRSAPAQPEFARFIAQGAENIEGPLVRSDRKLFIWPIPAEYAERPADFDTLLLNHLPPDEPITRRWLRLSPRYLGPQFRRLRSLTCDEETASKLINDLGQPLHA